jgi:hypothetical protein
MQFNYAGSFRLNMSEMLAAGSKGPTLYAAMSGPPGALPLRPALRPRRSQRRWRSLAIIGNSEWILHMLAPASRPLG